MLYGKDTCFWDGHYGPTISEIYLKILPLRNEIEEYLQKVNY